MLPGLEIPSYLQETLYHALEDLFRVPLKSLGKFAEYPPGEVL